jgi:nitrate/nitrite transport system permease protein
MRIWNGSPSDSLATNSWTDNAMLARVSGILDKVGLAGLVPFVKLAAGEDPREQIRQILFSMGVPLFTLAAFVTVWHGVAQTIETSLGTLPGPAQVFESARGLVEEYRQERAREEAHYAAQSGAGGAMRPYRGRPTFVDQIATSLKTVFTGFLFATFVAVPLGVACGLSRTMQAALNPIVQLFRPVSPLAWLPIVTMVVAGVYVSPDPMFERAFLVSSITVALCSLWPTLINTAVGVASVDKDLLNVARVLRLSWFEKVRRIVLPSSLELIFTGLRLSLGVGWMVLIAAEMLAQNPGLGKFVWDEFQNGSSQSLARIMVAVLTIGFIGLLLDRAMFTLQRLVSWTETSQ